MVEGYFEFGISCYLQIIMPLDTKNGERVSTMIGYTGMIIVLIIPVLLIFLLFQSIDTL